MHRYSVDNAIVYSSDDLVLFRESPFAVWMERLSLENPGHGIPPDRGSEPVRSPYGPQVAFAANLRGNRRDFVQIDWHIGEQARRDATLEAMRRGVHFIVDGEVSGGALSGPVNLLVRASGRSEFGDYLYMPGDTQGEEFPHDPFRLCFVADLLHAIQGQLPPQLLLVDPDAGLTALPTEDYIHYYRAVKQRFLKSMGSFDSATTPDPSLSSHCGRWSGYGNEILRQRQRPLLFESATSPVKVVQPADTFAANSHSPWQDPSRGALYNFDVFSPRLNWSADTEGTLAEQARRFPRRIPELDSAFGAGVEEPRLTPLDYIAESSRPPELLQNLTGLVMAPHPLRSRGYIGAHIWCTPGPPEASLRQPAPAAELPQEFQIIVAGA